MNPRKISIIIPAFNAADSIETCIRAIQANDFPVALYDILVADNGSGDNTADIARQCGAHVLRCDRARSIAAVRNMGAAATQGDTLLFLDADVQVPENYLRSAADRFDVNAMSIIGFVDEVPPQAGWVGRTWGGAPALKRPAVMPVDNLPGRNLLVSRTLFEQIGGFDETLKTGEDKELCMRAARGGYKVYSIPSPRPVHLGYDPDMRTFVRKEFWRQSSALLLARRHGFSPRSLRHPLLSLWHLGWGMLCMAAPLFSGTVSWIWPPLFLWLSPAAAIALKTVRRRRPVIFLAHYFILTFIRWNIAGAALVYQLRPGRKQD